MPTPRFITDLRALVGTRPLWLSCAIAVVLDDGGRVLLGRRADNGQWSLVGGIIEPGEQPADTVARECFEETGVVVRPEALTSVTVSEPIVYANGDHTQYLELTFRCRAVGGEARVNDEESTEVRWFDLDALPTLNASTQRRLTLALDQQGTTAYDFSGLDAALGDSLDDALDGTAGDAAG